MEAISTRLERPIAIAATYLVAGIAWIVVTDYLVFVLVDDPGTMAQFQTAKGWLFVAGSTLLIYGLVRLTDRRREETTDRLEQALQQTSVLHRLLRHNLRNNCNIIQGNVELLEADGSVPEADPRLEEIRVQTELLVALGSKTRYLRDAVLEDDAVRRLDLVALVDAVVETSRERYPAAVIETDLPDQCRARTTPRLERALEELVDNAVEHNDRPEPTVRLAIRDDDGLEIAVEDDGPGIPDVERTVLEDGIESPMVHSEGLGLWITRTIVVQAGGDVRLLESDSRGTTVVLSLPK